MPPECQLPFGVGGPANETKSLRRLSAEVGGSWYNVSLSEGVLAQTGLFNKWHIGNAVSPYWFARALAKFAGLDYTMVHSHDTSGVVDWHVSPYFMRHLPRHVPRSACPDLPALVAACAECSTPHCLMYPHESTVAWPAIQDVVLKEMREAFETWMPLNKMTRPKFEANDVVIQDRCDQTTLLAQWMYGPAAFRYYDVLRNHSNVRNIYIIRDPNTRGAQRKPFVGRPFYPCQAIHAALCSYLSALVPNAKIHSGGHKDINADFASVVYAPILFRGVSTFSLWGGLANRGVVYSTALFTGYCHNASRRPDFGPNWRYVDVPYLDAASVAKIPGPKLHVHQVHRIINWLMTS